MAVTVREYWQGVDGDQDRRAIRYYVEGAADDNDALNELENPPPPEGTGQGAPLFYDNMPRENIRIVEMDKRQGMYEGTAFYTRSSRAKVANDTNQVPQDVTGPNAGTSEDPDKEIFSFEVAAESTLELFSTDARDLGDGGNRIITKPGTELSGGQVWKMPGFNFDTSSGYRGANFLRPNASFTLDLYPEDSKVTRSYQNAVMEAVGKLNNNTFRRWARREVLLSYARGESRNGADWRFSLSFIVKKTIPYIDLGNGVTFTDVPGWDYIDPWYEMATVTVAGKKATIPLCRQATQWEVYEDTDFSVLFI